MSLKILRLATSHTDRHSERMSVDALKSMVEQSNEKIIPLDVEHDPRISPVGRIIQTKLVELDEGEFAIDGIAEMFDSSVEDLTNVGDRKIPIRRYTSGEFKIVTDRTFRDEESKKDILELSVLLKNAEVREVIKKALDPISILTIGGAFVLTSIASGFFGEIGADGYRALKKIITKIFDKNVTPEERLLHFEFTVTRETKSINIEVILTNPSEKDINNLLDSGFAQLDLLINEHFENELDFARVVYNYKGEEFELNYSVLKNGIPLKRAKNNR